MQESLSDSKRQVDEGLERERKLEEEIKELKDKIAQLEDAKRKEETELKEQLEEIKIKVSQMLRKYILAFHLSLAPALQV